MADNSWMSVTNETGTPTAPDASGPTTISVATNPNTGLTQLEQQLVQRARQIDPKLDPMMVVALKRVEDASEDPNAVSSKGARGIMQVLPSTRANLIAAGKLDPKADNITAGITALSEIGKEVGYNPLKMAAYYNGGHAGANNVGNPSAMPAETQAYMPKVASAYQQLTGRNFGSAATTAAASDVGASAENMGLSPLPGIAATTNLGNLIEQTQTFTNSILRNAGVISHNVDVGQKAEQISGQAAAQGEIDKQAVLQGLADKSASYQSALGTNPNNPNTEIMRGLFSQLRNAAVQQAQYLQKYEQSKTESFWDNPLQHIKFALLGNDYARGANAAGAVVNDLSHTIQQMGLDRQTQDSNDAAATAQISTDMAQDAAKKDVADAAARAAALGITGASAIMGAEAHAQVGIGSLASATSEVYKTQLQAKTTSDADKHQTFIINKEQKDQADENQLVQQLAGAQKLLGAPISTISPAWIKSQPANVISVLKQVATTGIAGDNPYDALVNIRRLGDPTRLSDQTPVAYGYLSKLASNIEAASSGNPLLNRRDPGAFIGPKMTEILDRERALPDASPMQSPYHIASPRVMLQVPSIAHLPIAKVLAPVALTGPNVNSTDIANTVADAINNKEISLQDAGKQLAQYYQQAIAIQNKAFNHKLLAIAPMTSYMAKIDGISTPVNMADPAKAQWVLNLLVKKNSNFNMGMSALMGSPIQ